MSLRNKVLIAMGIIMLICFLVVGFFAFPIGIPLCGIIGLIYGLKYKDRKFVLFSSVALVIGIGWAVYAWLLVNTM